MSSGCPEVPLVRKLMRRSSGAVSGTKAARPGPTLAGVTTPANGCATSACGSVAPATLPVNATAVASSELIQPQGTLTETNYGRDHHPRCYSLFLAGAGVNKGHVHGETDDYSYNIVRDGVHVHDLNATILHLLGINHERLNFKYQGLDMRLTGIAGNLVKGVLA